MRVIPPTGIRTNGCGVPMHTTANAASTSLRLRIIIANSCRVRLSAPEKLLDARVATKSIGHVRLIIQGANSSLLGSVRLSTGGPIS